METRDQGQRKGVTYDWNVVNNSEERSSETCDVKSTSANTPLTDDSQGNGGFVALVDLQGDENGDEDTEGDKKTDDLGVVPGVFAASPLESQEHADDGWDEDGCSLNVHECELVLPG